MNYPLLRAATLILGLVGVVCAYLFLTRLDFVAPQLAVLYFGSVVPTLLGCALFVYKSKAGIKKPAVALLYWALWASYSGFFALGLAWLTTTAAFPAVTLVVLGALLCCILFSCPPSAERIKIVAAPMLITAASVTAHVALLNRFFAGYR